VIITDRLWLIPCSPAHFRALRDGEAMLAAMLGVAPAEGWLGFEPARQAMHLGGDHLRAFPRDEGWWTWLFLHRADRALIGLGGYMGRPGEDGVAEIGYALAPGYQGQGLATEAARGMAAHAFAHPAVTEVRAHTLPGPNSSTAVLERLGMVFIGEVEDPEDGLIWRWAMGRP